MDLKLTNIPPTTCNSELGSLLHKVLADQAQAVTSSMQLKLSKDAKQPSKQVLKTERHAHSWPKNNHPLDSLMGITLLYLEYTAQRA
eukprot:scaffold147258_cov16-Prasinocladus_malaysianus.AAC.2